MNRQEHLLTILGEECSELHQEVCKALRFGMYEQRDLPTSNAERLLKEFNDLIAMSEMVNDFYQDTILHMDFNLIRAKKEKVEKYLLYSKECGTLTE
jgi:hypothetical protein